MKNIFKNAINFLMIVNTVILYAQIGIGTSTLTNNSVLLEFGTEPKGIVIPQVTSANNAVNGTFVFDAIQKVVKVKEEKNNGTNNNWTNMTTNQISGKTHQYANAGVDNVSVNGVVIGDNNSIKPGALVLESTTKALVLPKVSNPSVNIKSPIAGTIVYDTDSSMLAVYDGNNWSYWK